MANVLANLVLRVRGDTKSAQTAVSNLGTKMKRLNKDISLTRVALAGAGFAFAAKKVFDLGAAVGETASKYNTVFGPAVDEANEFLAEFANMAGLSERAAQDLAGTTGAIVQGFGFAQRESAALSAEVLRLAGDFASFNNLRTEDTTRAITAALTGEREQMKQLGVVLREVEVQQAALALSGKSVVGELTQQDKVTATLALITEKAGVQIGDLARTQDSAANKAKQFGATLKDMADTIAVALQPAFAVILEELEQLAEKMQTFIVTFSASAPTIAAWAAISVQAFKLVAFTLAAPIRLAFNLGQSITELGRVIRAFATGDAVAMESAMLALDINFQQMENAILDVTREMLDLGVLFGTVVLTFPKVGDVIDEQVLAWRRLLAALTAVNEETKKNLDLNNLLSKTAGIVSFLGGLGPVGGLLGKATGFLGLFDDGGTIPAGRTGIVGERGPELVSGPASVTSRTDTAAMMGGGGNFTFIFEQDGVEVRRISKRIGREESLRNSLRLALPSPVVG